MKKFIEVLEEVKETYSAIKAAEAKEDELVESYTSISGLKERHEARKAVEGDMIRTAEEKKDLQIAYKILKNNARIALLNEVMPAALEVLAKYNGKPYGEKTKQKICDEVKEKTNCRFYISTNYSSQSYDIYPDCFGGEFNISCGTVYNNGTHKALLADNKIQLITFEEIELYYMSNDYVEDVPGRVEELKTVYEEAVAKQKELEKICSRYNNLAVGDLKHIYCHDRIYTNIQI